MITEEQYIQTYDKIGHAYFCKGSDESLRNWGHTEEGIKQIKIKAVKNFLEINENGVRLYKVLNEVCGGKNFCTKDS